jgi:hypothetical protein
MKRLTAITFLLFTCLFSPVLAAQDCQGGSVPDPCIPDSGSENSVVGVSEILTPYYEYVVSYSATEVGAQIAIYYDARVDASLYLGGSLLWTIREVGILDAEAQSSPQSTVEGRTYRVESEHLLEVDTVWCDNPGEGGCYAPYSFTRQWNSGTAFAEFVGSYNEGSMDFVTDLGGTSWSIDTTPPRITAVYNGDTTCGTGNSPASATRNSSGYFTICGSALTAGGDDPSPDVLWDTGGNCPPQSQAYCVSLTPVTAADDKILVAYTIALASNVGPHRVWVMTYAGYSNMTQTFSIGDPTPVITSVTPNSWLAGTTIAVTITGIAFGTSPSVTVTGPGVSCIGGGSCATSNPGDTSVSITVIIAASASSPATVTVTSNGYNANGFQPAQAGQRTSDSAPATISPFDAPVPQIKFNGSDVANKGEPVCPGNVACVFVGQRIALTAVVPDPPSGLTVQTYSWSRPEGTVVAGYSTGKTEGTVQTFPATKVGNCQTLTESCLTFYWVDQGVSRSINFSYTLSNGQGKSATVVFNVTGPSEPAVAIVPKPLDRTKIQIGPGGALGAGRSVVMYFGSNAIGGPPGITLTGSANRPSANQGQYSWIQVLTKYNWRYVNAQGRWVCPLDASPEGDGGVVPGAIFEDTPWVFATPDLGETAVTFEAKAYLMWTPNQAAGCTGSACTILVPLALLNWSWTADAINTRPDDATGGGWIFTGCQNCSSDVTAQPTGVHPEWKGNTSQGCQPAGIQ